MPDIAAVNRSLSTIRTELEYLRDAGVVSPPQFQSIMAQLPQPGGAPSPYVDPKFTSGQTFNPAQISQQAQDPNNPAHPQNPKHHEWAKQLGAKFGNAALWGAGATFGSDMVNDALKQI